MSGESARQQSIDADTARFAAEYRELGAGEEDSQAAPDEPVESEAGEDGALAVAEAEEASEDIEDDAPLEDESEGGDWEKRYQDQQKYLQESREQLKALKSEQAEAMSEITQMRFDLTDKMNEAEQVASFWAQQASQDVQRLSQINPQQLTQEQYVQWQQQLAGAQQRAQGLNQALSQTQAQAKQARDAALQREAAVSRAHLERAIDNFQDEYPRIGKFAVDNGVNPKVWQELTDPGLVKLLYRAMKDSAQPDAIEHVETKTKARKQAGRNVQARDEAGRFKRLEAEIKQTSDPKRRRDLMVERDARRIAREYGS